MFIDILFTLLKERKITKNRLLNDLGLNKSSILNWEKRGTVPNGETLQKIADYFGVSVDYLLGKEKKPATEGELNAELFSAFMELSDADQLKLLKLMQNREKLEAILSLL